MKDFSVFCINYKQIENYELAEKDNFIGWVCHHRNGEEFSREWLKKNNMYYNRKDPHEFRFVPKTKELSEKYNIPSNNELHKHFSGHKHTKESKKKISNKLKGHASLWTNKSEKEKEIIIDRLRKQARKAGLKGGRPLGSGASNFGIVFKEHYGFTKTGHESLYASERQYYKRHGHYRWEEK